MDKKKTKRGIAETIRNYVLAVAAIIALSGVAFASWDKYTTLDWSPSYVYNVQLVSKLSVSSFEGQLSLLRRYLAEAKRVKNWESIKYYEGEIRKIEKELLGVNNWEKRYKPTITKE